ncbi:hypothetical protein HYU14_02515 [Candidatus Woesearchaeota archaeon]|nr:hypothetical protein [Candidatus Woesearchaeota archaeon]
MKPKPKNKNTITAADVYGLFRLALAPQETPFNYIKVELENKNGKGRMELFGYDYSEVSGNSPFRYPDSDLHGNIYVNTDSFAPLRPRAISFKGFADIAEKLFGPDGYIKRLGGRGIPYFLLIW